MLYAAANYIAIRGTPSCPSDLVNHDCLLFARWLNFQANHWALARHGRTENVAVNGNWRSDDTEALLGAAMAGAGIAILPELRANRQIETGRLVQLLPEWSSPSCEANLLFVTDRRR